MKVKKINTKLSLNKTTVSNLDEIRMKDVKGGAFTIGSTCETCLPLLCPTRIATLCYTCPVDCD